MIAVTMINLKKSRHLDVGFSDNRGIGRIAPLPGWTILTFLALSTSLGWASHQSHFSTYTGTETCLKCHMNEAKEVHASIHYQWQGNAVETSGLSSKWAGKMGGINDFCIYPDINFIGQMKTLSGDMVSGGCGQCHAGLGEKPSLKQTNAQLRNIDCLICHSELYARKVEQVNGKWRLVPDTSKMSVSLLEAAWAVQSPSSRSCLKCHSNSGGGNNFKRGDLS